jgi:hypothetical protein
MGWELEAAAFERLHTRRRRKSLECSGDIEASFHHT